VAGKIAYLLDGSRRFMPEYEAAHVVADEHDVPLSSVIAAAQAAFKNG
jgi:hypothetical protein